MSDRVHQVLLVVAKVDRLTRSVAEAWTANDSRSAVLPIAAVKLSPSDRCSVAKSGCEQMQQSSAYS
jgi:hypothetical protein